MTESHDVLFRTLADPTRRALFERLCRDGDLTVTALTAKGGITQPAVSKHLAVLKRAGLVSDRHEGRQTHYSARLDALAPIWSTGRARWPGSGKARLDRLEDLLKRMDQSPLHRPETRSVIVERDIPHPPEKIWRALTQPHLIEEWLMKNDFAAGRRPPVQAQRLGRGARLRGACRRAEPAAFLYAGIFASDDPAFALKSVVTFTLTPTGEGTHLRMEQIGLPAGPEAGLRRCHAGLAGFHREARTTLSRSDG